MKYLTAKCLVLLISCICIERIGVYARTSEELCVVLPDGSTMVGSTLVSLHGRPIRCFRGIPYAKPPIGDLRFKNTEPIGRLPNELDATKDGNICMQLNNGTVIGSEDCLYLNVYTPPYQHCKPLVNLPVIMFIHGGSFARGDGTSLYYGPEILLDHDVILVCMNYRLGPLGFMSSGQEDCPGNFGLKDQVQALRWINQNINAFGGDRNRVTIYGESAGALSVTYLMESPLTRGLINNAIAQSGVNVLPFLPNPEAAPQRAMKLAELMNCTHTGSWSKTMSCLRAASAKEITAANDLFFAFLKELLLVFGPVYEPNLPGAVVTEDNRDAQLQKASEIRFMTGITHDEGAIISAPLLYQHDAFDVFAKGLRSFLPVFLLYDHYPEPAQELITNQINSYYFNNEPLDAKKHGENLTKLATDGGFLAGVDKYSRERQSKPHAKTYMYLFSHKGSASYTEVFGGDPEKFYGICHADDLQYVFPLYKTYFSNALPTKGDILMREILPALFVNFARTGNPTPPESKCPNWYPVNEFPINYYRIGNYYYDAEPILSMQRGGIFEDRIRFWRDLNSLLQSTDKFV